MPRYSTNELKEGAKVILDGAPCSVLSSEFYKPGKGQAVYRVMLRNLLSGQIRERTLRSGDKLERADVVETEAQYLYTDGSLWHFMKNDGSYEQLAVPRAAVEAALPWLLEEDLCNLMLYNGDPVSVEPPLTTTIEIADTDPGLKGNTVAGGSKPATLKTGARIKVPLFVQTGEKVKVNTRTGEYLGRSD